MKRPRNNAEGYDKLCKRYYTLNVVDGSIKYPSAFDMRDAYDKCGMQARYYDGITRQDNLLIFEDSMTSKVMKYIDAGKKKRHMRSVDAGNFKYETDDDGDNDYFLMR